MAKHSAQVTIDTEDSKALRMVNSLNKSILTKRKKDNEMQALMRPICKRLVSLQERMERALLDLDTPLDA